MVSVEEYLATTYRPDCDYIDGEVQERNVGLNAHSRTLTAVLMALHRREGASAEVLPSLRLRVSEARILVPDICLFLEAPHQQVPSTPPFLVAEVVDPEDRIIAIMRRVNDYLKMGVPHVWVVDPETKSAHSITPAEGWREVKDGVLRTANPAFEVPLSEIFA